MNVYGALPGDFPAPAHSLLVTHKSNGCLFLRWRMLNSCVCAGGGYSPTGGAEWAPGIAPLVSLDPVLEPFATRHPDNVDRGSFCRRRLDSGRRGRPAVPGGTKSNVPPNGAHPGQAGALDEPKCPRWAHGRTFPGSSALLPGPSMTRVRGCRRSGGACGGGGSVCARTNSFST